MLRLIPEDMDKNKYNDTGLDDLYYYSELNYTSKAVVFKYKDYEIAKASDFEIDDYTGEDSITHNEIFQMIIKDCNSKGYDVKISDYDKYGWAAFRIMDNRAFLEAIENIDKYKAANILKKQTDIEKVYDDIYNPINADSNERWSDIERLAKKL